HMDVLVAVFGKPFPHGSNLPKQESPRWAPPKLKSKWNPLPKLKPSHAVRVGPQLPLLGLAADRQNQGQNSPGIPWVDQAVIPQPCGAEQGGGAVFEFLGGGLFQERQGFLVGFYAAFALFFFGHNAHHLAGLGRAHNGSTAIGPGEDESRVQAPAAHGVVAGAVGAADHHRDFRDPAVGHGLQHLGAVFDDAVLLRVGAYHEARGVVQEQDGCAGLVAELDKLCRLGGTGRGDRAVVADDAYTVALNPDGAAYGLAVVVVLEIQEPGAVGDAGEDLAHVVGLLGIGRNHAQQLVRRIQGLIPPGFLAQWQVFIPGQGAENLPGLADAVGVVFSQVFSCAGHGGVHFCTAQLFISGDFTGGRFQQWRAGQEHLGLLAHGVHVIGQAWLIGTTSGGVAVNPRYLGNTGSRHAGLVGKAPGGQHEDVGGVVQVGATGFRQRDHRKFVLHGDLLQTQGLVQTGGGNGSALDGAVACDHQAAYSGYSAYAGNNTAASHG